MILLTASFELQHFLKFPSKTFPIMKNQNIVKLCYSPVAAF